MVVDLKGSRDDLVSRKRQIVMAALKVLFNITKDLFVPFTYVVTQKVLLLVVFRGSAYVPHTSCLLS